MSALVRGAPWGGLTPYPFQAWALHGIIEKLKSHRSTLLSLFTGGGKCLGRGTPVLRFDGEIIPVESIRPGDRLMGPDSTPRIVMSTTAGVGPLFRITPSKGSPWVCNSCHVMTLVDTRTSEVIDVPLDEHLRKGRTVQALWKLFSVGVDFAAASVLPIDPYVAGIWLGDGTKSLTSFMVSKPDTEIRDALRIFAATIGAKCIDRKYPGKCPAYHITMGRVGRGGFDLLATMRSLFGSGRAVRIPKTYLTSCADDRLQLLAGLLDTDGYLHQGGYEIVQANHGLADDIAFLARSLGFKVTSRDKVVNGGIYRRLFIAGHTDAIPLRIARKKASARRQIKNACRAGFTAEPIGNGEFFGFTLDGDGRFLLGDFTVTHNTTIFGEAARLSKGKVLVLCERDAILDQAVDRIEMMTGEEVEIEQAKWHAWHSRIVVASKDSMKQDHRLERFKDYGFTFIIVDEAHHAATAGYQKIIANFPNAKLLFVTATPTKPLLKIAESIAYEYRLHEAMRDGWACPVTIGPVTIESIDLSRVRRTGGDLNQQELDAVMAVEETILGTMGATYAAAGTRQTIVSATSIHNARRSAEVLNRIAGKTVAYAIDSKDERNRTESRAILDGYRNGDYQYLCNVGKAGEGFDAPRTACLSLNAPTSSFVKYMQNIGRGMRGGWRRPIEGKDDCLILDFVGNVGKHSLMTAAAVLMPGAEPEVQASAYKRARTKGMDMLSAITEELEDRKKRLAAEAEKRKFIVPRVNWKFTPIDPFKILKVSNPSEYVKTDDSGPASEAQIARMLKWGIDIPKNMTKRQASKVIIEDKRRRTEGLANFKQIKLGFAYGYNLQTCTHTRAKMLLSEVYANGGRAISRERAAEIIMGREPGEDA